MIKGLIASNKTIENIIFSIENQELLTRLFAIQNGKICSDENYLWIEPDYEKEFSITLFYQIKNIDKIRIFVDQYVRSFCNKSKIENYNDYFLSIEQIERICDLDWKIYDIKIIGNLLTDIFISYKDTGALESNELLDSFVEYAIHNSKIEQYDFRSYIDIVLTKYSDKVIEYKNGKSSLLNLFLGEVIKSLPNKNVSKEELRNQLEDSLRTRQDSNL